MGYTCNGWWGRCFWVFVGGLIERMWEKSCRRLKCGRSRLHLWRWSSGVLALWSPEQRHGWIESVGAEFRKGMLAKLVARIEVGVCVVEISGAGFRPSLVALRDLFHTVTRESKGCLRWRCCSAPVALGGNPYDYVTRTAWLRNFLTLFADRTDQRLVAMVKSTTLNWHSKREYHPVLEMLGLSPIAITPPSRRSPLNHSSLS